MELSRDEIHLSVEMRFIPKIAQIIQMFILKYK